mgnify:FL=1
MSFAWNKCKIITIIGDTGSGKTACGYSILDKISDRPKYILNHPVPKLLSDTGIKNIKDLDTDSLRDCALWIDEPQLIFPKYDKRNNDALLMLYSIIRQKDIVLLLSTSDTRWINKGMEAYVDTWVIKDLDFTLIKQGSTIKKIIAQKYHNIMPAGFSMDKNEAILYCRNQLDRPENIKIPLPSYWSEKLSKPYKYSKDTNIRVF